MNAESQKRKIKRFLKGNVKDEIDPFCIYQWIERCHFERWWDLAINLSSHITSASLKENYQKRLDFIIKQCRNELTIFEKRDKGTIVSSRPHRSPIKKIIRTVPGNPKSVNDLNFENDAKQTLCQIYSVLYYMRMNNDFSEAVNKTKKKYGITSWTVIDKCTRRFAGNVETFKRWYRSGEILMNIGNYFHLSHGDYRIFQELLKNK